MNIESGVLQEGGGRVWTRCSPTKFHWRSSNCSSTLEHTMSQSGVGSDPSSRRRQPSCVSTRPLLPRQAHWIPHTHAHPRARCFLTRTASALHGVSPSPFNCCAPPSAIIIVVARHSCCYQPMAQWSSSTWSPTCGAIVVASLLANSRRKYFGHFARQLAAQSSSPVCSPLVGCPPQ